jgi:hypothetical protein
MVINQFENHTECQAENLWYKMKIEDMGLDDRKQYDRPKALTTFDLISLKKLKEIYVFD